MDAISCCKIWSTNALLLQKTLRKQKKQALKYVSCREAYACDRTTSQSLLCQVDPSATQFKRNWFPLDEAVFPYLLVNIGNRCHYETHSLDLKDFM